MGGRWQFSEYFLLFCLNSPEPSAFLGLVIFQRLVSQSLSIWLNFAWPLSCQRPDHVKSTSSRPITAVKQHWARIVLGWETARELWVPLASLLCLYCQEFQNVPDIVKNVWWKFDPDCQLIIRTKCKSYTAVNCCLTSGRKEAKTTSQMSLKRERKTHSKVCFQARWVWQEKL